MDPQTRAGFGSPLCIPIFAGIYSLSLFVLFYSGPLLLFLGFLEYKGHSGLLNFYEIRCSNAGKWYTMLPETQCLSETAYNLQDVLSVKQKVSRPQSSCVLFPDRDYYPMKRKRTEPSFRKFASWYPFPGTESLLPSLNVSDLTQFLGGSYDKFKKKIAFCFYQISHAEDFSLLLILTVEVEVS